MSASLVGSEMCIRDSHVRPPGLGHCDGHAEGEGGRGAGRHGHHPHGGERCLLYTSDAADDM
eukprot:8889940-Alexandrium_andersonii.AAC.1